MTVNNVYTTRAEFHDSLEPEMVGGGLGTGWQSQSKGRQLGPYLVCAIIHMAMIQRVF